MSNIQGVESSAPDPKITYKGRKTRYGEGGWGDPQISLGVSGRNNFFGDSNFDEPVKSRKSKRIQNILLKSMCIAFHRFREGTLDVAMSFTFFTKDSRCAQDNESLLATDRELTKLSMAKPSFDNPWTLANGTTHIVFVPTHESGYNP